MLCHGLLAPHFLHLLVYVAFYGWHTNMYLLVMTSDYFGFTCFSVIFLKCIYDPEPFSTHDYLSSSSFPCSLDFYPITPSNCFFFCSSTHSFSLYSYNLVGVVSGYVPMLKINHMPVIAKEKLPNS